MSDARQPDDVQPDDVQPDDVTIDDVQTDDVTIERLRLAVTTDAVVWGDDEPEDDPAVAVLLAVLRDVTGRPPVELAPLADVLPLRRRQVLVRSSAVAACALGLLSVGGVAAASPGSPLYALRTAVSDAISSVVDAVSPSGPAAQAGHPLFSTQLPSAPTPRRIPTATLLPTVPAGSAPRQTPAPPPARTVEAARLVASLLDRAQAHLTAGRFVPAGRLLDVAGRRLPEVTLQDGRAGLTARLAVLRAIADAGRVTRPGPSKVRPTGSPAAPRAKQSRAPATKDPKPPPHETPAPEHPGGPATGRAKPHPTGRP